MKDDADQSVLADYLDGDAELAREIKHKTRTIATWRAQGQGPAVTLIGRRVYYHKDDVKNWLRARATK